MPDRPRFMARMRAVSLRGAVVAVGLATVVATGSAQEPAPPAVSAPAPAGILFGTIRNELETPVAGAQISVEGTGLLTRSDPAGRFILEEVPAGLRELVVQ